MKYYLTVGAVFKNEKNIIKEWVSHYKHHGVDHIYLINDGSTDNFLDEIQPYINSGYVDLYDSSNIPRIRGRQGIVYDTFLKPTLTETKWLSIVDLDEFLYSPEEVDLKKIVKNYENYSKIVVNWAWFNSNGHKKQPKSVVKGFTKRAEYGTVVYSPSPAGWNYNGSDGPKAIVNTSYPINSFGVHDHVTIGDTINLSYRGFPDSPKLILNHYALQSRQHFEEVRMKRADADDWWTLQNRHEKWFEVWDIGEIEDTRLYEQNKNIIEEL